MNSLKNSVGAMIGIVWSFMGLVIFLTALFLISGCSSYPITPDMEQELERNKDKITEPNVPLPPRRA